MKPGIEKFHKAQINGKLIDSELEERYALREDMSPVSAYKAIHEPLTEIINTPTSDRTVNRGRGAYDSGREETVPRIRNLADAYRENISNAEVNFYLTLEDGHKYQFEAVPRTDFDPENRIKPPAFVELQHRPDKHESTSENSSPVRYALRFAMGFEEDYLERIDDLPSDIIDEIDLLTAFYREGGLHDQIDRSSLNLDPVIRESMGIVQADGETVSPEIADETVAYISEYLTDDFKDGGFSQDERISAGRHIGTAIALGLSFRHERESEELFGSYSDRFGRYLAHIDPEGGIHTTDEAELAEDRSLFVQQIVPMGDRESVHEIEEEARKVASSARDSSKDWINVLPEQLPENWRDAMPEENFI